MLTKQKISDLAYFGGFPAFSSTLHVGRPNVGDRDAFMRRVDDIFDRRWLTNRGPFVRELEQKLADYLQVKHCVVMANATIALEITARALGLKGEVIVPSFTFIATAHALQWQQITPVFCDVAPGSHHLDPQQIERLITPRTTGIVGVHVWGQACDTEAIDAIAQRHSLKVMYDAAHAFGCTHNGRFIGSFGAAEVFSFHATKFFNTFEGGAVTTNDDALVEKLRLMQNFGFEKLDTVTYIGTNGKMSEISAAMGLTGLDSLDEFLAVNQRNYHLYLDGLDGIPGLTVFRFKTNERNNYQYIVLELDEAICGLSRDRMVALLHAEQVRVRRYFYPACHKMEPYRSYFPHAGLLLAHTERLVERVMTLPTGTAVTPADVAHICQLIRFILDNADAINQKWAQHQMGATPQHD